MNGFFLVGQEIRVHYSVDSDRGLVTPPEGKPSKSNEECVVVLLENMLSMDDLDDADLKKEIAE